MPRPERPIDATQGPIQSFAAELRKLRTEAGSPPYRELARDAHFSKATLSDAASGHRLPTLEVTLAYVGACGGDVEEWRARWHALRAELGLPAQEEDQPSEPAEHPDPHTGPSSRPDGGRTRFVLIAGAVLVVAGL
ncbi:MAG TPA: helix-turn-helix transcriptional regulator, partial [Streptosporangiaceae bacterium]|nr:helix-turn-helix transcriptional regulator [Streptosporangiaceae bacterium]